MSSTSSSLWKEHKTSDGRKYYYNTQTKETSWAKPDELLSPRERALAKTDWKEYETPDGRKYWHNKQTNESVWKIPEAYRLALEEAEEAEEEAAERAKLEAELGVGQTRISDASAGAKMIEGAGEDVNGSQDNQHAEVAGARDEFSRFSAGGARYDDPEAVFTQMLKEHGIDYTWTWERAIREIIEEDTYTAVADAKQRRAVFDKFVAESRRRAGELAKETIEKRRNDFVGLLKQLPEVKSYSRWKTILPLIKDKSEYLAFQDDDAKETFYSYTGELRKKEDEETERRRQEGMASVRKFLEDRSNIDVYTRWHDVKTNMKRDADLRAELSVRELNMLDILAVFEEVMKKVEKQFLDERKEAKRGVRETERHRREAYVELMEALVQSGEIKHDTRWMDIYKRVKDDERYVEMVGQVGSTPQELFWDEVEKQKKDLRIKRDIVLDILAEERFEVGEETKYEEFEQVVRRHKQSETIDDEALEYVFERQRARAQRRAEEDRHQEERRLRRKLDGLRSVMRHLEPPMTAESTWEEIRERVKDTAEFAELEEKERVVAFEKQLARTKEDSRRRRE
ncbi:hypothetical protein BZA70DRAFT_271590 [Myxozyma melibiosi]|uniref:Uncharacterized protein n=1 Tax=Myxozyma melibiosi TaxID=54550 RepID=A0ABR1FCQ3_9ASCO